MTNSKPEAKSTENSDDVVKILGIKVNRTTQSRVLEKVASGKRLFLVSVNPEYVVLAQDDPEFRHILNSADLALADGVGLKLAVPDLEIIPGRKLVAALLRQPHRFFFLGGQAGVAEAMAARYGGGFDPGEANLRHPIRTGEVIVKINKTKPDILLTAYNAPEQEKWLWANRSRLRARVMMGVGGTFDYLTGRTKLPPEWVEKLGLEWMWRLIQEPWRWKRQLKLLRFLWLAAIN